MKRLRHIPNDRRLVRQLWKDPRLERLCDIETDEPSYGIAVLSKFRSRVGPERLMRIVDHPVEVLVKKRMPVIPYPRNQMKGVRGILRVDRRFRSHGPQDRSITT